MIDHDRPLGLCAACRPDIDACQRLLHAGLFAFCKHSVRFPARCHDLPDPPMVVYGRGDLARLEWLDQPCVTIVGARKASAYGVEVARALARGLAQSGVTVISGMAFGIDSAAHEGALSADTGQTVAVLAGGPELPSPRSKRALYEQICACGLVLTEAPPGFKPLRRSFPARNRIMAALAKLTLVIEASTRSGALITAEFARDIGRDVGAVPGPINSEIARGSNALLADGALVVTAVQDVLDELFGVGIRHHRPTLTGSNRWDWLLRRVEQGHDTVERIAANGCQVTEVLAGLGELELTGLVRRTLDGRYTRTVS